MHTNNEALLTAVIIRDKCKKTAVCT